MALYGSEPRIDESGLSMYGENVARLLRVSGRVPVSRLSLVVREQLRDLARRSGELEKALGGKTPPPAAGWLLDNMFLIRGEGSKAAEELDLRVRLDAEKGLPALYRLCLSLVASGGGRVSEERCRLFFRGCQAVYVLNRRELSLLVPMLRAALIGQLHSLYAEGALDGEAALAAQELIGSLRLLSTLNMSAVLEDIDKVEQLYRQDPAGVYPEMSEDSRASYRNRTAALARRRRVSELRVAEKVLLLSKEANEQGRHIGHWLFTRPPGGPGSRSWESGYICAVALLSLFGAFFIASAFDSPWAALVLLLPVSEIVKYILDLLILNAMPCAHIPRLELEDGIPARGRCLCVISALLTSEEKGPVLARRLEEYRLANRDAGKELLFGILADFPDSAQAAGERDEAIASASKEAVDRLNEKYGGGFFLFIRDRKYSPRDKKYMAWERKRGAVTELARRVLGRPSGIKILSGNENSLTGTRYILTLDEDTRLTPGSARELAGAMLHPLNRPVVGKNGVVVSGRALIQPRMSTELSCINKSGFSRIFAGQGGCDPYGCHCSELYMDAFGSGGFAGKGILDAEAFLTCLEGRIPENAVLSHDALEGAYLRGGLMTDVELTDCFPSDVMAYFKRMHRWVRGDWQNSPWLFSRGRDLAPIERFRLFDSLRRSLFPPACLFSFLLAFFLDKPGLDVAGAVALMSAALPFISAAVRSLFKEKGPRRCRGRLIRGVNEPLLRLLVRLILLPFEAWICLSAAVTALWRMLVSHRNMLNWTPASVFDGMSRGLLKYYGAMWPCILLGLALAVFCPSVAGISAGIVWITAPAAALALSLPPKKRRSLSQEDSRWLLARAGEMWGFFRDFCVPEDNFLPPDNFQVRPPVGAARRSSPTNIGLCLLSCLSALDLGLARLEEALELVGNILTSLERMPKWEGHLYNWYDNRTLKPLRPAFVSTVDSGNLAACLIILREGLLELGEEDLARRCGGLLAPMSFSPLYDQRRRLFSIGMDPEKDALSKSWYDLMASEARTASFVAIARGDVPRRHWKYLSRAQVSGAGLRGMVSWTGSMFEYLMPRLFFASLPGSSIYETEGFCVDMQRLRVKKRRIPWGISESAYYSLDPALNYRYKAHGCASLALKRGMNEELVVSPYSSYLALACRPGAALKNLRRLFNAGLSGKYGLWEAVDFSPDRVSGDQGEAVMCVMAHHLGMSLIAITNRLLGDLMPKRLMQDPSMAAFGGLLEEKLPLEGAVLRRKAEKAPEKPPRSGDVFWERRGDFAQASAPECCLLSNGDYSIMLTDSGHSSPQWRGLCPYFCPKNPEPSFHGFDLWLLKDGALTPLLPSPEQPEDTKNLWEFTLYGAKLSSESKGLRSQMTVNVSSGHSGERRRISASGPAGENLNCRLVAGLSPILAPYNDYVNHPAFYGMGLEAKIRDGMALIKRIPRNGVSGCCLCLAASVPLKCSFHGQQVPGRGGLAAALEEAPPSAGGWLTHPRLYASMELRLAQGSDSAVTLALAVGKDEEEALRAAQLILAEPDSRAADYPASRAKALGMDEKQVEEAMELLRTTSYPAPRLSSEPRSGLWPFGVSGDLPVLCAEVFDVDGLEEARRLIRAHSFLCSLERPFDLVFVTDEGGDYLRPMGASLEKLRHEGGGSRYIHIADRSAGVSPLFSWESRPRNRSLSPAPAPKREAQASPPVQAYPQVGWNPDGSFSFLVNRSLPPRAWGNMLTNGRFGFFATDCGTGHMWYGNSREYRINRWLCDSLATSGTESLSLNGETVFASPLDRDCRVTFGFGWVSWEKTIGGVPVTAEAFVPAGADCRVLIIRWEGGPAEIEWSTDLVLGGGAEAGGPISVVREDGLIRAENADSPFPDKPFLACSNRPESAFRARRLHSAVKDGETPREVHGADCLCLGYRAESPFILVCGCDKPEKLLDLCSPAAASRSLDETRAGWKRTVSRVEVETPLPSLDRLINGWLPYQTLACRLMGRCSIYQSGGAMGFRDQLQDAVNLMLMDPSLAGKQILLCCRRQYREGDVMHWWHDLQEDFRGVRTRCSDDLLWLPWALCEYVEATGDLELCSRREPWLDSRPLEEGERDRYETGRLTEERSSVTDHCLAAANLVLERGFGPHGLLKSGGGDWNDGMDRVGIQGRGESVWLSWFFSHTARRLATLMRVLGRAQEAACLEEAAALAGRGADRAWDGGWYLRGYFDDGTPLGSSAGKCCRIDSVAQSFSALCPQADRGRVNTALDSALELLFDREKGLVLLFDPPFENASPSPGYIESYGPGFRENGGQYTHAAVWLIMALIRENRPDEALELIRALIPEDKDGPVYGGEPFVLAADVLSNPACTGAAGWTWYTGAAGWLWRVVTGELLGLRLTNGALEVSPRLPREWEKSSVRVWVDGKKVLDTSPEAGG